MPFLSIKTSLGGLKPILGPFSKSARSVPRGWGIFYPILQDGPGANHSLQQTGCRANFSKNRVFPALRERKFFIKFFLKKFII